MFDQLKQKVQEPTTSASIVRRHPRTSAIVAIVVLGALGIGVIAAVASTGRDEQAIATELADAWNAAWSGTDADAVADLFVEDGVYVSAPQWGPGTFEGREAIRALAKTWAPALSECRRTSEVTEAGDGVYQVTGEFKVYSRPWRGEVEFEVQGDLLSRYEFLFVEELVP